MATSIKLIRRYVWLAETISRAGRITIDEINRKWRLNSTLNDNHESEIPERTFHRHREAIADIFGIVIQCDRRSNNEYYIENPEVLDENSFTAGLFSRLVIDNRLLDNGDLSERILNEEAAPGTSLLPLFIDALQHRLQIDMSYRSQFTGNTRQHTIEPQFLKKWHQRWYIVAKHSGGIVTPFALDRVISAKLTDTHFAFDPDIDPESYFADVTGVNTDPDYKKERILVKVDAPQRNYLDHLPLHHSQHAIETTESYTLYEYHLRAEYEFQHELMKMGESIEVLLPQWLRHQIRSFAEQILQHHQ